MSTDIDKIGVARDHRWVRLAEQKRQLEEFGCRRVLELADRGSDLDDIVQLGRPDRTFVLVHAFLLADPGQKRRKGGLKANLEKVLDRIAQRGSTVTDLETGLTTADAKHRKAILAVSHSHIARSNRSRRSALNGARSRGRPRRWGDPKDRQIIWDEWHSSAHATNTEAADEASRRMGKRITHYVMWKIVSEMREAKGLKPLGASGRRPNSAAAALAATVGKPDPSRTLPKARVRRGVVYFIKNGDQARVRIGFSEDHKFRMASLQSANPDTLTLIGTIPGNMKLERKMHRRFDAQRIHPRREWFRIEGALVTFLRETFPKFKRT